MTGTRISFLRFVVACPFGLKVYTTSTQPHRSRHKCVQHLCQNKCLRDQNWHFECPLIFHQQIMVMRTGSYNHTNIGKNGDISCKICHFYKCVYCISAKIILVSSASIFVGEWLQRQGHFWAWPLYILFKSDGRHRMHCLVFTDTDLYSLTKGKSYLAKHKWGRSTCLLDQCYDIGCHPWYSACIR